MSEQWLIFLSQQGHSAKTHGGLVHPSASIQVAREHPPLFPLGTLACSQSSARPHQCEPFCPEGGDPHLPVHKLLQKARLQTSETHNKLAALIVEVLL